MKNLKGDKDVKPAELSTSIVTAYGAVTGSPKPAQDHSWMAGTAHLKKCRLVARPLPGQSACALTLQTLQGPGVLYLLHGWLSTYTANPEPI